MGRKSREKQIRKQEREQVANTPKKTIEGPLDLLVQSSSNDKPSYWKKGWKLFWAGLTASSTLFGAVTGLLYFSPSVSVDASSETFSKDYPLDSIFILANQGNLPLKDVRVFCRINHIRRSDGIEMAWGDTNIMVARMASLSSKDRTSMKCDSMGMPPTILTADITFFVLYKAGSWMLTQTTPFRFRTIRKDDKFLWVPEYTPDNSPFANHPKYLSLN